MQFGFTPVTNYSGRYNTDLGDELDTENVYRKTDEAVEEISQLSGERMSAILKDSFSRLVVPFAVSGGLFFSTAVKLGSVPDLWIIFVSLFLFVIIQGIEKWLNVKQEETLEAQKEIISRKKNITSAEYTKAELHGVFTFHATLFMLLKLIVSFFFTYYLSALITSTLRPSGEIAEFFIIILLCLVVVFVFTIISDIISTTFVTLIDSEDE